MKRSLIELAVILVLALVALNFLNRLVGAALVIVFFVFVIKLIARLLR